MLSVCRQYVSPVESAEELMLNGFFKAFKNLDGFNHAGSFEGWLRKIMVRECIDYLRKKNPFKYSQELEDHTAVDLLEEECSSIGMDVLQTCIDELPDGYKSIFMMYAVEEYKHREIAAMLDISENTSKSQYRKAKIMLRERIAIHNNKVQEA